MLDLDPVDYGLIAAAVGDAAIMHIQAMHNPGNGFAHAIAAEVSTRLAARAAARAIMARAMTRSGLIYCTAIHSKYGACVLPSIHRRTRNHQAADGKQW